jgi:L-ascorbate metabolism protein UlaG (beta-lactamase superfamily)
MGPDEAIKAFNDLGAKWLVPMHYGTFKLSFEALDEPPRWLKQLAETHGLSRHLQIMQEGVPKIF